MSSGVALCQRLLHPANWLSSTSRRSRSRIFSYVCRASGDAPVVLGELAHGPRRVVRQRVEFGLGQPGVVVRIGEQRAPLGLDRLLEQFADLLERAVEPPAFADLAPPLASLATQLVQAAPALGSPSQQARPAPPAASSPVRTSSPISSSAPAMSNGEASGSGPPSHGP